MYHMSLSAESVHEFLALVRKLEEHGALANTIVVVATRLNPLHCNAAPYARLRNGIAA